MGQNRRKDRIEIMIEIAATIEENREKVLRISMRRKKTGTIEKNNRCKRIGAIINFSLKNIDVMERYVHLYLSNRE